MKKFGSLTRALCYFGLHGGTWGAPVELGWNKIWDGAILRSWQGALFQRKLCPACGAIEQRKVGVATPVNSKDRG